MLLFSPVESCNKCQPGWMFLKSDCYYFSSRNKSDTKRNWDESRGNCVNQGGDLLVIDSLEEQVGHQPGRVAISAPKQFGDSKIYFKYLYDAGIVNVGLSHRDFSGI